MARNKFNDACWNCRFWDQIPTVVKSPTGEIVYDETSKLPKFEPSLNGYCRRYAPRAVSDVATIHEVLLEAFRDKVGEQHYDDFLTVTAGVNFPVVTTEDWCGEFKEDA